MKKFFYTTIVAMTMFAWACGAKKEAKQEDYGNPQEESTATESKAVEEGEALVNASDCKTCHHKTNKIIGPAHEEVAKKYEFTEANVKLLSEKVIKGGSGVWGPVAMTPHPDLSQADAEKMVRYVLSLDGEKEK